VHSGEVTYLDKLAAQIRRHVPPDVLPPGDLALLFRLYALLLLTKGTAVTAPDIHNAWAVWMQESDPGHPSIRPFDELDAETQAADGPFVAAVKAAAHQMTGNS
jgi:hypothetical protein